MANTDAPRGYYNPQTDTGSAARVRDYKSDGVAIIYPGDLVDIASGRIASITSAADNPIGVAAGYAAAVADTVVPVYDDLVNTSFEVQIDDNTITDDTVIGDFFDTTVTTGDTTRLTSTMELDGDASAQDTLVIVEMVNRPDNDDSLANNKVRVKIRVDAQATVIATT